MVSFQFLRLSAKIIATLFLYYLLTLLMKNESRHKKGIWVFLEEKGVLKNGTDAEIKKAKSEYRKIYLLAYKRKQRQGNAEYVIPLSKFKGEHKRVLEASQSHKTSITAFIKQATLAYLDKRYLVPDKDHVAELEQTLSQCRNEIQRISRNRIQPVKDQIKAIEKRIADMEESINTLFRNPPLSP